MLLGACIAVGIIVDHAAAAAAASRRCTSGCAKEEQIVRLIKIL